MESIELEEEYFALFEHWQEGQDSEIVPLFLAIESKHPGSFLHWFQSALLQEAEQSHLLFDYIFLFNVVIPQCINTDIIALLDCTELMMKRAQNDGLSSEAYAGLVTYCLLSKETLERVLQVLSSNLERWESCVSVIIQSCYTQDCEHIPQFIQDALKIDSPAVQYTLAMSISRLELSVSSEANKEHFRRFLGAYHHRFPSLPLGSMKAALFCVIMNLSSQLDDASSKVLLQSFFGEMFLMDEAPMEFSFSIIRYFANELHSKGTLTQQEWDIVSHLIKVTSLNVEKSSFPINHLMKQLYLFDPDQALTTMVALVKRNPGVSLKDFHEFLTTIKKNGKLLDFAIRLLLQGAWPTISANDDTIQQALDTSMHEISDALASFADLDHGFLARKGIATLWLHPSVLCPFLLALVIQSPDKQVQSMIKEYLVRWIVIPYPKAFRAYKEKMMQDASASEIQIKYITELYNYSVEFEATLEEIPRLKEIQPSLEQRYHMSVYDAEQQKAVFKQGKEMSIVRLIATEIPIIFANSTLYLHGINPESKESSEVSDMHLFEYSREIARIMVWDYPTFEIELSLYASEGQV